MLPNQLPPTTNQDPNILPQPVNPATSVPLTESDQVGATAKKRHRWLAFYVAGIVVVIIALVAFLLIAVVDNHSQDTKRKNDLAYIANQAEVYYGFYHHYPTLAQFNASTFAALSAGGFQRSDFQDPNGTTNKLVASPARFVYAYETSPASCNNTTVACQHFTLIATLSNGQQYSITGKH